METDHGRPIQHGRRMVDGVILPGYACVEGTVDDVKDHVFDNQDGQALHPEWEVLNWQEVRGPAAVDQDHSENEHHGPTSTGYERNCEPVHEVRVGRSPVLPPMHAGVARP